MRHGELNQHTGPDPRESRWEWQLAHMTYASTCCGEPVEPDAVTQDEDGYYGDCPACGTRRYLRVTIPEYPSKEDFAPED